MVVLLLQTREQGFEVLQPGMEKVVSSEVRRFKSNALNQGNFEQQIMHSILVVLHTVVQVLF